MLRGMQTLQSNEMLDKHAVLKVALVKVQCMVSCMLGTYKYIIHCCMRDASMSLSLLVLEQSWGWSWGWKYIVAGCKSVYKTLGPKVLEGRNIARQVTRAPLQTASNAQRTRSGDCHNAVDALITPNLAVSARARRARLAADTNKVKMFNFFCLVSSVRCMEAAKHCKQT